MKKDGTSYVLKVGEETMRYAQELLAENERLRTILAALKSEKSQMEARVAAVELLARDREAGRERLRDLEREKCDLKEKLQEVEAELQGHLEVQGQLRRQLGEIEAQNQRFSREFLEVEQQNNNLTNLYVASYKLHGTLDRGEVIATIQEIIANLVGSEEQAIFEMNEAGTALRLVASIGIDPARYEEVGLDRGPIGRAGANGELLVVGPGNQDPDPSEPALTACIPLKLNDRVTGAIALFRLLPQKAGLAPVDYELFDLLATHAATALYCTGLGARAVSAA
jgi:hypothetical protein